MGFMQRTSVDATAVTASSPVLQNNLPKTGDYYGTVVSYNATALTAVVNNTPYGTLTLTNFSTVALVAGHIVTINGTGLSTDRIVGTQ